MLAIDKNGTFSSKLTPLSLLAQMGASEANGYLEVSTGDVLWYIYFEEGKITYTTHSIEPLERIDRNLRLLGCKMTETLKDCEAEIKIKYQNIDGEYHVNLDYELVCLLVSKNLLNAEKAKELVRELIKEVVELYSWIETGNYTFVNQVTPPKMSHVEIVPIIKYCQNRWKNWQSIGTDITSPYQRPYLLNNKYKQPEIQNKYNLLEQRLGSLLKGFSFRQLAILVKQDELKLARSLQPYIKAGMITLHEPQSPFNKLPNLPNIAPSVIPKQPETNQQLNLEQNHQHNYNNIAVTDRNVTLSSTVSSPSKAVDHLTKANYNIVCVDDSPTILNEISRYLEEDLFTVHKITHPLTALMQILRLKPDLILMDVGMPNIDGYELCRLLRKNFLIKNVPIIMVTGNTGIIDRGKARLAGATDYLTKPFTQTELKDMVIKHLT